ncbi:hypothetical protein OS493_013885 [Desmophyllum pertusum]|uniref:NADH dehydrogenase [ubiquinone] 1 beta subcomplex subunit 4 n=1 Tax=Desmophyllum pertusum TaxID=174260 RepID=A0A9W9ZRK2_9CNID|nr:hypothetical protein OS493_013885 [Desmophyllum pertusum]
MADRRYDFPHGPNPGEESLKLKAKYAAEYKKTGKIKPIQDVGALIKDPAIEKFGWIRENTDLYFKFKPRSVRNAVLWCLLIPGALLFYIKKTKSQEKSASLH